MAYDFLRNERDSPVSGKAEETSGLTKTFRNLSAAAIRFAQEHAVMILPCKGRAPGVSPKYASSYPETIGTWFGGKKGYSDAAIPVGKDNDLIAVDCDVKHGVDGVRNFSELCAAHRDAPSPVCQITPSGGRHYFYRFRSDAPNCQDERRGIEIKAHDLMVHIDPLNERYQLSGNLKDAPPFPDWLVREFARNRADDILPPLKSGAVECLLRHGMKIVSEAGAGERNNKLNFVAYSMARRISPHAGELRSYLFDTLREAALAIGLERKEVEDTLESAIKSGLSAGDYGPGAKMPYFVRKADMEWNNIEDAEDEPEDDDEGPLGRLPFPPIDTLPESLRHVVMELAKGKQVPVELVFMLIFALGSACLGATRGIICDRGSNWKEIPNLFFLLIAESGTGKTHAYKYLFECIEKAEIANKMRWKEEQREYEAKLSLWRKQKEQKDSPPKKPRNVQYLLKDSTMEAMVERLEDNPRGLFWSVDEFNGFFQSLERYSKNGSQGADAKRKLVAGWESDTISATRKSQNGIANEAFVPQATLGLFGGIQPSLFGSLFSPLDVAQGIPQRFLFVRAIQLAPPVIPYPAMDEGVRDIVDDISRRLLSIDMVVDDEGIPRTIFIGMDDEAKAVFDDYHTVMVSVLFHTPMFSFAAKMVRMTLRIALVLHYLTLAAESRLAGESESVLCAQTMRDAIRVADWFYAHTKYVQGMLPISEVARMSGELTAEEVAVAQMILDHEAEIERLDGKVPNQLWKEWLAERDIALTQKTTMACLKNLKIGLWHTRESRGKEITRKSFACCSRATSSIRTMFGEEQD